MPTANQADNYDAEDTDTGGHPTEIELLQYLEGGLTAAQVRRITQHLETCTPCFQLVVSVREEESHPFTAQDLEQASKLPKWKAEGHVAKLLEGVSKLPEKNRPTVVSTKVEPRQGFNLPAYWRPLAIAATLVIALSAGWKGFNYYQTGYQVAQAGDLLQERYVVFYKDARLSGGYRSSPIGVLLGNEEEKGYLKQSRARLGKALSHGEQSLTAQELLAQTFIIAKDYVRADSVLRTLAPSAQSSPKLLNDLGVYYFQQQDWANAEKYLSEAIRVDPQFPEAKYNLALVRMKTGSLEEARKLLQDYLAVESDANWRRAAEGLQDEFRE